MAISTKGTALALACSAILAVGSTSYAVGAASSSKTIAACYSTKGGDLRYLKSGACRADEKKLVWNLKGLTGDTGKTGAPGLDGTDGRDGADSVSAEAEGSFGGAGTAINSAGAVVAETTLTMPYNGYVVANGVGTLEATGDYSAAVCSFRLDGAPVGHGSAITTVGPSTIDAPIVGTTRFFAPAGEHTVSWRCQRQSQGDSVLYNAVFTLVTTT